MRFVIELAQDVLGQLQAELARAAHVGDRRDFVAGDLAGGGERVER